MGNPSSSFPPTQPHHSSHGGEVSTPDKRWFADLLFAATQQTGVAATLATVVLLHERIGKTESILLGLLIGLGTAFLATVLRQGVRNGGGKAGGEPGQNSD